MNKLIKFELRNLSRQKSFLICLIISAALIIIGVLASNLLNQLASENGETDILLGVNAIDSLIGYFKGGNISILMAIFVSIYFGSEVSDGTIKNIISKGYSRGRYFISKLIGVVVGTIVFLVSAIIINYLMCLIVGIDLGKIDLNALTQIGSLSLCIISEAIFFSFFAMLFSKTSASIIANICIPILLPLALALIDILIKSKISIADFWIENTMGLVTNNTKIPFTLIVAICYISVFTILGLMISKQKEIK